MVKIKKYYEKAREAKERFSEWRDERKRIGKVKARERYKELVESLGRQQSIEEKRSKIRGLQQKFRPKGGRYPTARSTAKVMGAPSIFDLPQTNGSDTALPGMNVKRETKTLPEFKKSEPSSMLHTLVLGVSYMGLDLGFGTRKNKRR